MPARGFGPPRPPVAPVPPPATLAIAVHDVTAARAFNVIYQNNSGNILDVHITTTTTIVSQIIAAGYIICWVGPATPPAIDVGAIGNVSMRAGAEGDMYLHISFKVPRGWFYQVVPTVANVALRNWIENEYLFTG